MSEANAQKNLNRRGNQTANIPDLYLFSSGGLHFYTSSCCEPPEHFGSIVTKQYIPQSELGCGNKKPITMGPRTPEVVTTTPDTFLSHVSPTDLYGTPDIGNEHTPTDPSKILYNAALVAELERVKFTASPPNPLVENRLFKLSHFEVCYFKSVDCNCETGTAGGDGGHGQTGGHGGHSATHGQQKPGLKLVHYHLLLAECTHRQHKTEDGKDTLPTPLEIIEVSIESSLAFRTTVNAGRLLRLTGTAGVYQGATILALNNVA